MPKNEVLLSRKLKMAYEKKELPIMPFGRVLSLIYCNKSVIFPSLLYRGSESGPLFSYAKVLYRKDF